MRRSTSIHKNKIKLCIGSFNSCVCVCEDFLDFSAAIASDPMGKKEGIISAKGKTKHDQYKSNQCVTVGELY